MTCVPGYHALMPSMQTLIAFAVVSVLIMIVPGPSNLFLLAHGIGRGRRSALAALIGMETALAIRVLLTAGGLSTVLVSSALAFGAVRWAGVAYLTALGIWALLARRHQQEAAGPVSRDVPAARSACKGLIVGLANPKVLMFFIAFLPQFVHPGRGSAAGQLVVLGAVWWVIGMAWDLVLADGSGTIGGWLRRRPRVGVLQSRAEGSTYLGLAGWAAFAGGRPDH